MFPRNALTSGINHKALGAFKEFFDNPRKKYRNGSMLYVNRQKIDNRRYVHNCGSQDSFCCFLLGL